MTNLSVWWITRNLYGVTYKFFSFLSPKCLKSKNGHPKCRMVGTPTYAPDQPDDSPNTVTLNWQVTLFPDWSSAVTLTGVIPYPHEFLKEWSLMIIRLSSLADSVDSSNMELSENNGSGIVARAYSSAITGSGGRQLSIVGGVASITC